MFSLRSILLATAAIATIASAIPAPQDPDLDTISKGVGLLNGLFGNALADGGVVPPLKRGALSFGDHFADCHDKIELIVIEIGK